MENILFELAKASPVALVSVYAIWRISIVMIALTQALTTTIERLTEVFVHMDVELPKVPHNGFKSQIIKPQIDR